MKKIVSLCFLFLAVAILNSCTREDVKITDNKISLSNQEKNSLTANIPFADDATLKQIASNSSNVSYKTAHKIAVVSMQTGLNNAMNWQGAKLSEKPVIVYDGKSNAKYYEFIVLNGSGNPIGTITACAKKEIGGALSHVLPYVRDYSFVVSKGGNYKMISGGYPSHILLGIPGKGGDTPAAVIDPETGNTVTNVPTEDAEGMITALSSLGSDQLSGFGITNVGAMVDSIKMKDTQNQADAQEYWGTMSQIQAGLDTTSDEVIEAAINGKGADYWNSYEYYYIPSYNTKGMTTTRWSGWCGPSVVAWIYRGLYSSYKGTYLPLATDGGFAKKSSSLPDYRATDNNSGTGYYGFSGANDLNETWVRNQSNNSDNGLYEVIANNSGLFSVVNLHTKNGLTFPPGLSAGLLIATNGKYNIMPLPYIDPLGTTGHLNIRTFNLPTICIVDWLTHYVVAFGSEYEYSNWDVYVKIFGHKVTLTSGKIRINKWLLCTDDGFKTKANGYKPYWTNDQLSFNPKIDVVKNY